MGKISTFCKYAINLSTSLVLLASALLPPLTLTLQTPVSAATIAPSLKPGETIDNNQHIWESADFTTASNYTPVGKNTVGAGWVNTNTYNFGTDQEHTGSWLPFNGGVDMQHPIKITGTTYAKAGGLNPGANLGDANGILLTDLPAAKLSQGATGQALGIGNLGKNTYFIGNDYAFRELWWPGSFNSATVIAQGDGSKAKILNASSDYAARNASNNPFTMEWKNPVPNPDGTITGEMSYTSQNDNVRRTASTKLTVQKSMSIGFMAATGGNYAKMSVNIQTVVAGKGSRPAIIHYSNATTGEQLAPNQEKWKPSTVIANIGNTLRIVAPNATAEASDYFAPVAPSGYQLRSISKPIIIQNFPDETANPNQLNVAYTPLAQTSHFIYEYSTESKHTPDTPAEATYQGVTDQRFLAAVPDIQKDLATRVPDGYYISKMITSSGTAFSGDSTKETLESFLMTKPFFSELADNNNYQVSLSPRLQVGTVSFNLDQNTTLDPTVLPSDILLSGLTGETISFNIPTLPIGYAITQVIAPNHKIYPSVQKALIENSYYRAVPNDFHLTVSALPQTGTVTYRWASNVPGQNGIDGKLQANLPPVANLSGVTNSKIEFAATVPKGYMIDTVIAPDGKTYTDTTGPEMSALEAAQKANPTFVKGSNTFLITLKAIIQPVTLRIIAEDNSEETPPDNLLVHIITNALTGASIKDSDIELAQEQLDKWMTDHAVGWGIKAYQDPNGGTYTASDKQLKQAIVGVGGHVLADNNQYQATIDYNGTLTFSEMPSIVDFGSQPIAVSNKSYNGKLNNSLIVSDTRGKKNGTPWQLSVRETSPITEVIKTPTNTSGSMTYTPLNRGISFANQLSYDGTVLTKSDKLIYETDHAATGETTIIEKDKPTPLSLSVPIESQKSFAIFKGQITWTLSSTP